MSTQQSGLVSGNKQNAPGGATKQSRSRFPESYSFFQTERFAEYFPFFVMEGVSGDSLPLYSNHEVQTYNLKSPILQSLSKKKDYFAVPMQAILPFNWEKFYTNPNIGQDVPDDSGLGVANFWSKMKTLFTNSWISLPTGSGSGDTQLTVLQDWLKFFIFFEQIYSCGSLMESLGISGHNWFVCLYYDGQNVQRYVSFDEMFDDFMGSLEVLLQTSDTRYIEVTYPSGDVFEIVGSPSERTGSIKLSLREALERFRDDLSFTITQVSLGTGTPVYTQVNHIVQEYDPVSYMPASDAPLNLGRLWAYQLVVSHFYSNDHIDFIYSAELFRQYIFQLVSGQLTSGNQPDVFSKFVVNGYSYIYDALSAHSFNNVLDTFGSTGIFARSTGSNYERPSTVQDAWAYFVALFSFKRSLRFMDYFTGSRSLPLAVGDHEVAVNAQNKVDIIELSRVSMMTKFLQAVNRSGRKFSNYMKELFGITTAYDYHNPMYLAHTSDLVGASETENTGDAQMSDKLAVTSRLRATSNRYAFEFHPDRDCIVLGLSYYDIPRVYTRATERQNFVVDRFDMFNPYLQFIGDQPILQAELGTTLPLVDITLPFSYTNKDMHYKQRYNQAAGGFLVKSTGLDHWIFSADELQRNYIIHIGPSFIRSFNSEIDKFYQGLTGYSLGTYFHFIVRYDNRMDASRPMAYNPVISV